ncbi:MAG: ankyrin repeat domain-containing protein [Proteobacteria bacterium]|nr:ankyrin repeat domain-containing protein [Pseudomonadota bacterium]
MDLHICQEAVGKILNDFARKFNEPIVGLPDINVMKNENTILFSINVNCPEPGSVFNMSSFIDSKLVESGLRYDGDWGNAGISEMGIDHFVEQAESIYARRKMEAVEYSEHQKMAKDKALECYIDATLGSIREYMEVFSIPQDKAIDLYLKTKAGSIYDKNMLIDLLNPNTERETTWWCKLKKLFIIKKKNTKDIPALLSAATEGRIEDLKALLKDGVDVNAMDMLSGSTPLSCAIFNGHLEIVEYLINSGADINAKTVYGVTILSDAAVNGHMAGVTILLNKGAKVNIKDMFGSTALWRASINGHTKIVKLLLEAKAKVNIRRKEDGKTPLYVATSRGHTEVVKLLLKAKAKVNIGRKEDGKTPLDAATSRGHAKIAKLLKEYGA